MARSDEIILRSNLRFLAEARAAACALTLTPNEAAAKGIKINKDGKRRNVIDLLGLSGVDFSNVSRIWPELGKFPDYAQEQLEIDAVYSGYLHRQKAEIEAFKRDEGLPIPTDMSYGPAFRTIK